MRNKDDSTPPTWIDPKAAMFHDKPMRVCVEHLSTLRANYGDETMELSSEDVDIIFDSLVVPNVKKRCYPIGNLELPSSSQHSRRHCVDDEDYVRKLQKPSRICV